MKCRKMIKKAICIFLSVVILFFSINNSYLSPHKMDTVNATGAVIAGGVAITAEVIIELIAAIGVTALGAAIIDDVVDWDWNAICNDVHDWCRDNVDVLDQYVTDGTSALKEWALADEWVVIEGGGGSPDPSPSPDDNNNDYSEKVWGASDIWTIGNLIAGTGVLGSEFYNKVVSPDEGIIEVAKQYVFSKANNFSSSTATDPITLAFQSRFQPALVEIPDGYAAWSTKEIVRWNVENLGYKSNIIYMENALSSGKIVRNESVFFEPVDIIPLITSNGYRYLLSIQFDDYSYIDNYYSDGVLDRSTEYSVSIGSNAYLACGPSLSSTSNYKSCSSLIPFYEVSYPSYKSALERIGLGISPDQLFSPYGKNYIDTDGEYGWASTADLSPGDLAAANPALANNLIGKDVSISSLVAAINALKQQLEDQNPNTSTGGSSANPLPYPDVPTYSAIVNNVVTDPDVFPSTGTSTDPGTDPGTSTDPGTDTGINYSGLLGTIIGLLQQILQAIKDFMAWFVIDFPAIKAHLLEALDSVPGVDGLDPFLVIITDIKGQITDHYDYPKITIQTPEILVQFVKAPEIVLLDFKDYAEYFIWVRTAMAFAILFGFAMWCVHDIKVELTLN